MELRGQLSEHRFDLSKSVLYLSALGLFAKLWQVDVSGILLPGVVLKAQHAAWASGLLGIVLIFALLALIACIVEIAYFAWASGAMRKDGSRLLKHPLELICLAFVAGLSFIVYAMPLLLGGYATWKLWPDTCATAVALWRIL